MTYQISRVTGFRRLFRLVASQLPTAKAASRDRATDVTLFHDGHEQMRITKQGISFPRVDHDQDATTYPGWVVKQQ